MSGSLEFLENLIEQRLANLHTCTLAKIEKYDPVEMKATVQPLIRRKFRNQDRPVELPPIVEVPVVCMRAGGFVIRPPYKKGDIVLVAFGERAIDTAINTGKVSNPDSARKHSLDDAVVIGGLLPFSLSLPGENGEDMVIAKEDFSAKIVIEAGGNVVVETNKNADIKATGNVGITAEGKIDISAAGGPVNITASGPANVVAGGPATVDGSVVNLGAGASEAVLKGITAAGIFDGHVHIGNLGKPTSPPGDSLAGALSGKVITE